MKMAKNRAVPGEAIHSRTRDIPAFERDTKEAVNHRTRGTRKIAVSRCPRQ
jgi:hypothetical protein